MVVKYKMVNIDRTKEDTMTTCTGVAVNNCRCRYFFAQYNQTDNTTLHNFYGNYLFLCPYSC
jgi:hypothetical protein